jgi:guanine nucleotide-binding protein G(I)/G(S)/G(T) subunit beta-1
MSSITQRIADANAKLQALTAQFSELQAQSGSLARSIAAQDEKSVQTLVGAGCSLKAVRSFNHHASDATCVQWSGDDQMFVSAGKDGQVAVWNALTKKKVQSMTVDMKMLMTCAFEKKKNQLVAAGGADKVCSVFTVGQAGILHPIAELAGHDGYISQCQFLDDSRLVSASGDSTACLWDIRSGRATAKLTDHAADCLSVALHPDATTIATGSSDCTVKLSDLRSSKCTQTLTGHESDVNGVTFFPDGHCLATASTDSTCRLFDLRTGRQLASFENADNTHNNCSALSGGTPSLTHLLQTCCCIFLVTHPITNSNSNSLPSPFFRLLRSVLLAHGAAVVHQLRRQPGGGVGPAGRGALAALPAARRLRDLLAARAQPAPGARRRHQRAGREQQRPGAGHRLGRPLRQGEQRAGGDSDSDGHYSHVFPTYIIMYVHMFTVSLICDFNHFRIVGTDLGVKNQSLEGDFKSRFVYK